MKTKFEQAIAKFDAANTEDPNKEKYDGKEYSKELLYAQRLSQCLDKIEPHASEALKLAVRCQHIQRWKIPRGDYPMDRQGYKKWRNTLAKMHADIAGKILEEVGYDKTTIEHVQGMLRKEKLKTDHDTQLLEDIVCLVFLEYYFADFFDQHKNDREKVLEIIRKTWNKMSSVGHTAALELDFSPEVVAVIEEALSGD
jgi:hypothetical protein